MPSFLSPQGSNRLRKARKTDDEGVTTTTTTGTTKVGGSGRAAATAGRESGEIAEPRRSFVSFTRKNTPSSNNPKPLQHSESWKRRFDFNILTRGKNRTSTEQQQQEQQEQQEQQQGIVSSRIGDVRHRHQSIGSAKAGEFGARSKDGVPLRLRGSAQQQQQKQQASALGAAAAPTKSKLSKARPPALSGPPSRLPVLTRSTTKPPPRLGVQSRSAPLPPVIASAPLSLSLELSPQQYQPQQQQQQQQQHRERERERELEREQEQHQHQEASDGMAATTTTTTTTTMTSVMQEPKPSFSFTLTVDELPHSHPRHAHLQQQQQQQQQQPSSPPPQTQRSNHHYHPSSASPPPPANVKPSNQSSMFNARKSSLPVPSPSPPAPNAQNQTSNAFRQAPIELSMSVAPQSPAELSGPTPLSYYITPSQTPTPDRSSGNHNPTSILTVMRPGPATPPPTESDSTSSTTKLTILTDPSTTQVVPWQGTNPHGAAPEDRPFNDPPTPASSASSHTNPVKRVNFAEQLETTPTSSIRHIRSNLGNTYPTPPPQSRYNNYRPPPPHPLSGPRNNDPRQLPLHGPPHGREPLRLPPARPPSPIYMNPPNMKTHLWAPLRPTQINCAAGHTFVSFRNKQHSILCTICRSMEFEGRGEPVKRSFYCSWCAVRMCADCTEELMEECGGNLTELWNRTEEKRASNMVKVKEGKMKMVKREDVYPTSQIPTGSNGESFGPRGGAPIAQGDARSRTPQGVPFTVGFPFPEQRPSPPPQRQLQLQQSKSPLPQSRHPRPEQLRTPQPQQSGTPRLQSRTPRPEQLRTPQPQQSSISRLQSRTPQLEQPKKTQPQQPRTLQPQQSSTPRLQSRTPQPEQPRTPQLRGSRVQLPQQPISPRPPIDKRLSDQRLMAQQSRSTNQVPQAPEKPGQYRSIPRYGNRSPPSWLPTRSNMGASPPPIPQLTPAETERYKLTPVASHQKPPSSGTVVLVGEKQKAPSIVAPSLKGSLKKKRGWFRGFGKKNKEVV